MYCHKTGDSKRIYLFSGKARNFRRRERHKESMKVKGIQTLRATDKCLMWVPNINAKVLKNTH
jgi:hypothetical protein